MDAGGDDERLISLNGGWNFRDIGGYPTAGGGEVRWGKVYRSAALHRLTAPDVSTIDRLGLRVVYDLRSIEEGEAAPSALPDGVRTVQLPIGGAAANIQGITDIVVDGELTNVPEDFLVRIYDAMIEQAAPTFGELLTMLAAVDGTPALFHCTAGKDRTGMAAALLLSVLGVDEELVLDDYVLSAVHYTEPQLDRLRRNAAEGDNLDAYRVVLDAPRHAMAAALGMIRERHGSVERYLEDRAGVASEVFPTLRSRLVA